MQVLEEVRVGLNQYLACQTYIGVSLPCKSLAHLPLCAKQAHSALTQARMLEESQAVCISDVEPGSDQVLMIDEYTLRTLTSAIKTGNATQASEIIATLMTACRNQPVSTAEYQAYLLEIVMVFIRTGRDLDLPLRAGLDQNMLDLLLQCPPLSQASDTLQQLCFLFTSAINDRHASSTRRLAEQATEYIAQHYANEDLSLEKVCTHLHISSSYFSVLFKKETQKTFQQYLTAIRMDKAMTILARDDLKTSAVASSVGISDPSYFSFVFKKHFGLSPSQVRKGGAS